MGVSEGHNSEGGQPFTLSAVNVDLREGSCLGSQFPTFHMGTHVPKPKKQVKIRRKEAGGENNKLTAMHGAFNSSEAINVMVGYDASSKRKTWDSDVVMEDNLDDSKRLCGDTGIFAGSSVSTVFRVAGVGVDQPCEQQ